jgi:hypothetical protein
METSVYLMQHDYDYAEQKLNTFDGQKITVQFKAMDNLTILEIVGYHKDLTSHLFKHKILCHKDQDLTILKTSNDQINNNWDEINVKRDRIFFETNKDKIKEEIQVDNDQFDEDVFVDQRVIFNTKHLIRDTFNTTVLNELQELIVDVLANRADSQKEETQIDLEDLIREKS